MQNECEIKPYFITKKDQTNKKQPVLLYRLDLN